MKAAPYTPNLMDVARESTTLGEGRLDGLHAEAKAALQSARNALRAVRGQYGDAHLRERARWQSLRDERDAIECGRQAASAQIGNAAGDHPFAGGPDPGPDGHGVDMDRLAADIGRHEAELNRLEVAQRTIENALRFLDGDVGAPVARDTQTPLSADIALRIVEAQENEQSRLAQEVHDGPAQALTNAIFQVEYIERVIDHDARLAQTELAFLRQMLRRELGDMRTFISQLRPRVLDQLGLDGSIRETAANMATMTGLQIEVDFDAPGGGLSQAEQTVVLRIVQEALQNVRKHAGASNAIVSSRVDGSA